MRNMSRKEKDSLESLNSGKSGNPDSLFEEWASTSSFEKWASTPPLLGGLPNPPKTHRTGEIKIFDSNDEDVEASVEASEEHSMIEMLLKDPSIIEEGIKEAFRDPRMRESLLYEENRRHAAYYHEQEQRRGQADAVRKKVSESHSVGDTTFISTGQYAGYSGTVESVDIDKGTMKVRPNPRDNDEWVHSTEISSKK